MKRGLECSVAEHIQRNKGKKSSRSPSLPPVATPAQDKDALIVTLQARIALLESVLKSNGIQDPSDAVLVPPFLFPFPDSFATDTTGNLSSLDVQASLALENLVRPFVYFFPESAEIFTEVLLRAK